MVRRKRTKRKSVTAALRKIKEGAKSGKYLEAARTASEKFVKDCRKRYGFEVKYEMDDIRLLDRKRERNFEENKLTREDLVSMGYYLAEVLRRNVGGYYEYREDPGVLVLKCADIAVIGVLNDVVFDDKGTPIVGKPVPYVLERIVIRVGC